jgi:signal transduction histidine kinase
VTIAAAVFGAATVVVVSFVPDAHFAYSAPPLHIFLETTGGLIALLAAYLVFGRFRGSGRLDDLLLACGLALASASALFFSALPAAADAEGGRPTWGPLVGRLLAALFLTCAAHCPATSLRHPGRSALRLFGAAAFVFMAIGLVGALVGDRFPAGLDPALSPPEALGRLFAHPVLLAIQFLTAALYAAAAVGFMRRAERMGDELLGWFSVGSVLACVASLHYFLFPSLYSRWVYTGDFVRLLSKLVLLTGAAREIGRYWRSLAAVAVLEERRRIARDLHDGLAQELAFILRRAKRAREADPMASQVAAAAERALADARRAIAALTRPLNEPLDVVLEHELGEIADRFGLNVVLDLEPNVRVDPAVREELVRIAREAVSNAARHGEASTVRVELWNGRRIRLTIADDGVGFAPNAAASSHGFGIVSMRERARVLDADFRLASAPGGGTEIEVTLP